MNAAQMREILHKQSVVVTFTKANGEEREMFCTLLPKFLPERDETTAGPVKNPDGDIVTVWDLEADGWRSFKASSVTSFQVEE